jgi:hypothetical protein
MSDDEIEALRAENARLRAALAEERIWRHALDASVDGTWSWDVRTGENLQSDRWKAALGYGPDNDYAATVEGWRDLLPEGEYERAALGVEQAFAGEKPYDTVLRYRRGDGSIAHIRTRAHVVRDEEGNPLRMIGTHTDVSDIVNARAVLASVLDEERRRTAELETVLRILAVDLRAPLRGILTLVPWILDDLKELSMPSVRENLAFLESRSAWLERVVDRTLAYSRETGGGVVQQRVDLDALAHDTLAGLADQLGHADVRVEPLHPVHGDRERLERVLDHLLANALQHGAATRITLHTVESGGQVTLTVADDGRGFPAGSMADPFRMFAGGPDRGGGVGLACCRAHVERMSGTIEIVSAPGRGTDVSITLPAPEEA